MKTAAKPAATRIATGTSASSSRLRALNWSCRCRRCRAAVALAAVVSGCRLPVGRLATAVGTARAAVRLAAAVALVVAVVLLARGVGRRRSRGGLEVVEQVDGVRSRAQVVVGERVATVLRDRARLHRARLDLAVELDPEGQVVGEAAVERHPAAFVDAEEVDLPDPDHGAGDDCADDQEADQDLRRGAPGGGARRSALAARRSALAARARPRRRGSARRSGRPPRRSGRSGWRRPQPRPPPPPRGGRRPR